MSSKLRWVWVLGVIVLVAMVVVACAPAAAPTAEEPITLDLHFGTDPPTLDPALGSDTTSIWADEQLYLALTDLDDVTVEAIPELATWEVSADGLVYTFSMRDDAKWVHYDIRIDTVEEVGPVTAHDVVYGTKRTLDPRTGSPYAYVLYLIEGGEDLNTADPDELSEEELQALIDGVGIKALDDYTVEVTLTQSAAFFPAVASMWVMRPMPQATIEEFGEDWVMPGNLVSNGPYVLTEWSHGAMLRFKKNPYYYDADQVQIEAINGPVIMETSTAFALYEAGELDIMADPGWGVPLPDMDRVRADPALSKELSIEPRLCTYYYGFVTTKPPFDNVLVRKAFAAAIDSQALIDNVLKGGQLPAHTFACPGIWGAPVDDMTIAPYLLDIAEGKAKAQEFLAEAGYPNCEGFPEVILMHNISEGHALIAQAIQEMWRENLGCTVKIETMEWSAYLNMLLPDSPDEDKPQIYRLGWCADYPDEANWVGDVFNSKSTQNYAKFFNDEFDAAVEEALGEQDLEKRAALYNRAEHLLIDENMAIAPIYYYTRVNMFKPYLTEHPVNPAGGTVHMDKWVLDWEAKKAALGLE